jgi:hypothetical protein
VASTDWTVEDLGSPSYAGGATHGIARPSGGGSFIYALQSLSATPGGKLVKLGALASGCSLRGALCRSSRDYSGQRGSVALVACRTGSLCYALGLAAGDSGHIILAKCAVAGLLPNTAPGASGVLRRSTETVALGQWVHLRLDVTVAPGAGSCLLEVSKNDLAAHPLSGAPVWEAIPGMAAYTDDDSPLVSGDVGFAMCSTDIGRRGYFDALELHRQL